MSGALLAQSAGILVTQEAPPPPADPVTLVLDATSEAIEGAGSVILTNGGLTAEIAEVSAVMQTTVIASQSRNSGVRQWEFVVDVWDGFFLESFGATRDGVLSNYSVQTSTNTVGIDCSHGWKLLFGTHADYDVGAIASGAVLGLVWDASAGAITFYLNGVSRGVMYSSGVTGPLWPAYTLTKFNVGSKITANFAGPFAYPVVGATPYGA